MKKIACFIQALCVLLSLTVSSLADITIKQRVTMSGQRFESTRRIKGPRERTEQRMEMNDPAAAAYMPQIATITQCDLKRRIQINDRKQLYTVEPFDTGDTIAPAVRPTAPVSNAPTRKGGTMTMSYSVRDTGERKVMFGLQARHLITTQEMESSPDSCNGPHKSKMEIDGWYVDFNVDFSCPTVSSPGMPGRMSKPDCQDRIVTRGTGTAPKGIMIEGTMKMYGADGSVQMSQTTETLDLSRETLDPALFDIPQGYRQAASSQDLYAVSMPTYDAGNQNPGAPSQRGNTGVVPPVRSIKTVSLNISTASAASASQSDVDTYVRSRLTEHGLRVVSGNADYSVSIQVNQIKESTAAKIGGIFGKVTGTNAGVGKVDIDLSATLTGRATGSAKVKNKFDGPLSAAVRLALDQALNQLLVNLNP